MLAPIMGSMREFSRELCERLERGAQASQHDIRVIQVALGDSTSFGEADFFRPSADQEGSLFLRSADATGLRVEKVEVRSLDSFRLPANFIKIDVEGAERRVLEGARDTIHRHQPLICREITRIGDSRLEYSPKAFLDQVDELGLILYNLVGVPVSLGNWENQDFFSTTWLGLPPRGARLQGLLKNKYRSWRNHFVGVPLLLFPIHSNFVISQ